MCQKPMRCYFSGSRSSSSTISLLTPFFFEFTEGHRDILPPTASQREQHIVESKRTGSQVILFKVTNLQSSLCVLSSEVMFHRFFLTIILFAKFTRDGKKCKRKHQPPLVEFILQGCKHVCYYYYYFLISSVVF